MYLNDSQTFEHIKRLSDAIQATKRNGEDIFTLSPTAEDWMKEIVYHLHNPTLPNDRTYEMIYDVVNAIVDSEPYCSGSIEESLSILEPPELIMDWEFNDYYTSHSIRKRNVDDYQKQQGCSHENAIQIVHDEEFFEMAQNLVELIRRIEQ